MQLTPFQLEQLKPKYSKEDLAFIESTLIFYGHSIDESKDKDIFEYLENYPEEVSNNIHLANDILTDYLNYQFNGNVWQAFVNSLLFSVCYHRPYAITEFLNKNEDDSTHLSTVDKNIIITNNITENNMEEEQKKYEYVNHPSHYNEWSYEVIDMFEKIYGTEMTANWCEITAMKYAMRMGFKPTDDVMQDLKKRNWYLQKAKELRNKLN